MATRHQVSCINKRGNHYDAHERISNIGGLNADKTRWKLSQVDAIKAIEEKRYEFYVSVDGRSVDIIIAEHNQTKYLKTKTDGYSPNNLLSLAECPA